MKNDWHTKNYGAKVKYVTGGHGKWPERFSSTVFYIIYFSKINLLWSDMTPSNGDS